jgi:hypothetical protein
MICKITCYNFITLNLINIKYTIQLLFSSSNYFIILLTMSKHIELRDDTRKISNLSITTSEIRRKFSTDWKPREIKTNGNRHNISTN